MKRHLPEDRQSFVDLQFLSGYGDLKFCRVTRLAFSRFDSTKSILSFGISRFLRLGFAEREQWRSAFSNYARQNLVEIFVIQSCPGRNCSRWQAQGRQQKYRRCGCPQDQRFRPETPAMQFLENIRLTPRLRIWKKFYRHKLQNSAIPI